MKECAKGKRKEHLKAEYITFIDLKNAYPSVKRDVLFSILRKRARNQTDQILVNNM